MSCFFQGQLESSQATKFTPSLDFSKLKHAFQAHGLGGVAGVLLSTEQGTMESNSARWFSPSLTTSIAPGVSKSTTLLLQAWLRTSHSTWKSVREILGPDPHP